MRKYLKEMNFEDALAYTKELLSDRTKDFEERAEIADDFSSCYPYFDSSKFDRYFLED